MFMDQKVNILKISVLFKVICRFNAISIKCQNLFCKKKKKGKANPQIHEDRHTVPGEPTTLTIPSKGLDM